ncbi:MAG: tetratricopeptide repeat protein [Polyangiaceae bacterium]|nr:tetratricopeptide repeat protein [Polyangiaceae bacterium]
MTRSRPEATATPELMLEKATLARDSEGRAKYARRGLNVKGGMDQTTRAMLLRQLYLSHIESRRFGEALSVALQMVETSVMPDVARQDAARACLGLERRREAIEHLRIASRVSPPSRRAFHLWTLGSVLYLSGQERHALGPLSRAVRWGTNDKPLYQAQVALAQLACGEAVSNVAELRERLADSACGRGYGQFVLGELAYCAGDFAAAEEYLTAFVERTGHGRIAQQIALEGELRRSRDLLARMAEKRRLA